jgi:hypothetical protein
MKLYLPYATTPHASDVRLMRLAQFLGVGCELVRLGTRGERAGQAFARSVSDSCACIVVNPAVLSEWLSNDDVPPDFAQDVLGRFPFILVHGLHPDPYTNRLVQLLSDGRLNAVLCVDRPNAGYQVDAKHREICGPFAGLSMAPVNASNDCVLNVARPEDCTAVISIGSQPHLAVLSAYGARVWFIGSRDVVDIDRQSGGEGLTAYFSRLMPHALAVRSIFQREAWRPRDQCATVMIDDPLLRPHYGFLRYDQLLSLMDQHGFHSSIAFIPHNYRKTSPRVARMLRERPDRYSLSFHGNDHTSGELATRDIGRLNAIVTVAETRMEIHQWQTGLDADRVMVFPRGEFSTEALQVLKAHNFVAAVNSGPDPVGRPAHLTLADAMLPAIVKLGGLPLFLRRYPHQWTPEDIAFDLFLGKPVLTVEHHDIFRKPDALISLVSQINSLAPEIRWTSLRDAVERSYLMRWDDGGTLHVRAYGSAVRLEHRDGEVSVDCVVEWCTGDHIPIDAVALDGARVASVRNDDGVARTMLKLNGSGRHLVSVAYRNVFGESDRRMGFGYTARAVVRRNLSELRDNYLSRNPRALAFAAALRRCLVRHGVL